LTPDLFTPAHQDESLEPGATRLAGFAEPAAPAIWAAVQTIAAAAPFRHLVTPGGGTMSVAMTNCGAAGWVSDRRGYRYEPRDPLTAAPWPAMPALFSTLAARAAAAAGFANFTTDVCLINRYDPGASMSLHVDHDERDFTAPIVSVSLGLPAIFLWGGKTRTEKPRRLPVTHGDVIVWGGPARRNYHGVLKLRDGAHPLLGRQRINLTFRHAL
jgi:alkylated DNA repair protein (DNA oxidative demethylase)